MDDNKNTKDYGEGHQQLRRIARKRKFNDLANDGHGQAAAEAEQKQQQSPAGNLNKKNRDGQQWDNDDLEVRTFVLK
jgi:hypothetical protein